MFNKFREKKDDIQFDRATDPNNLSEEDKYVLESSAIFDNEQFESAVVRGDSENKAEADAVDMALKTIETTAEKKESETLEPTVETQKDEDDLSSETALA